MLTSGGVANAVNPESANRKPNQDAGHFLGHPTPTYQWHGCTKSSTRTTPTTPPIPLPATPRGNKQKKVKWTVVNSTAADSGWVIRWEVAKGWKICGVQVAVRGSNPSLDADLAMQAGYTSGAGKGSTVKSGAETIKVKISKHEADMGGLAARQRRQEVHHRRHLRDRCLHQEEVALEPHADAGEDNVAGTLDPVEHPALAGVEIARLD